MTPSARPSSLIGSVALLMLFGLATPASAVTFDWVTVSEPGNPCDPQFRGRCFGAVYSEYEISAFEVTNAQYVEFLNAKAADDPLGLYDPLMAMDDDFFLGGIARSGNPGSYLYEAIPGHQDLPVNYLSFYDCLRFANWLENGQGDGDTETGAYTLLGGTPKPSNGDKVHRNRWATVFLTSENEWYKAAYYDPVTASYYRYPTGSDTETVCTSPGPTPNTANCSPSSPPMTGLTEVGSYTGSASPYGTFDQGGNVHEWTESIYKDDYDFTRGIERGGNLYFPPERMARCAFAPAAIPGLRDRARRSRQAQRTQTSVSGTASRRFSAIGSSQRAHVS